MTNALSVSIENKPRPLIDLSKTIALLGVCSGGDATEPDELTSGSDIDSIIGYGPGPTLAKAIFREAPNVKIVWQKITAGVAGTISAVTETPSGTGPLITITGTPYDSHNVGVKVKTAGPIGTAVVQVALDATAGQAAATWGDDVHVPAELPAAVTGTIDLTGVTLADLNTLTVIFTSDIGGPITTTLTTPSSVDNIASQINTAISAGAIEAVASIVSGKYLRIASVTNGAASTLSLGAGTAHTLLGLAGGPFTGSASTYTIPNTGLVVTFPTGSDYVLNTIYTASTVQPRFSVAASTTAFATLRDWAKVTTSIPQSLGALALLVDPADGAETRQFADALSSRRGEYFGDYLFPKFYMGTSLHVPSSTKATNDTNITTNDAAVKLAMQGHVDQFMTICEDDCYITTEYGKQRRSVLFWDMLHWARERISSDPGNRSLSGFSTVDTRAADGVTLARNEDTATHKMRGNGFTVAYREGGLSYIARGVTRANPAITPDFRHSGVVNAALLAARQLTPFAKLYINTDPLLTPAGKLLPHIADAIDNAGNEIVVTSLINEGHVSNGYVTVSRTEVISTTNNITIRAVIQANGQVLTVALVVGTVGTITDPLLLS